MKAKHSYKENDLLNRGLAVLFVVIFFFALMVETFHYHEYSNPNPGTTASIIKYTPQCLICEVISHQVNTNFVGQDFHFECHPPVVFVEQPFDTYQLHFYQPTLQTSKNKGPPATLFVAWIPIYVINIGFISSKAGNAG